MKTNRLIILGLLAFVFVFPMTSFADDSKIEKAQDKANDKYLKELVKAAKSAIKDHLYPEAEMLIRRISSIDKSNSKLKDLKKKLEYKDDKNPKASDRKKFHSELREIEKKYAKDLLKVAKECYLVLKKDESKENRDKLESVLYKIMFLDKSLTSKFSSFKYSYTMAYGLIDDETHKHYKKSEYLWEGKWISGKELREFNDKHDKFDVNPYVLESDHFRFTSSATLERTSIAIRMAEHVFQFNKNLFGDRLDKIDEKMNVQYFRSIAEGKELYKKKIAWEDFNESFAGYIAQDEEGNRLVQLCVFNNEHASNELMVCHEVTHLILYSSFKKSPTAEQKHDYWCSEASATFCESAQTLILDYPDYKKKVHYINYSRLVNSNIAIELKDLLYKDLKTFMTTEDNMSVRCYSSAFMWSYFFMNYNYGMYREKFLDYICAFHKSDNKELLFEKYMGNEYDKLNREFKEFWKDK